MACTFVYIVPPLLMRVRIRVRIDVRDRARYPKRKVNRARVCMLSPSSSSLFFTKIVVLVS